jgi:hypothetical protein
MNVVFALLLAATVDVSTPEAVVRALYAEVVARRPIGIPEGEDAAAIAPLLTKRLRAQLETGRACEADYFRQYPRGDQKPEFWWLEMGLFSGGSERALPAEVVVEHAQAVSKGVWRVPVRLTYRDDDGAYPWRGEVTVKAQGKGFAVDDVAIFDDDTTSAHWRLSEAFAACDGKRWRGQ